jgi:hypothetical protein
VLIGVRHVAPIASLIFLLVAPLPPAVAGPGDEADDVRPPATKRKVQEGAASLARIEATRTRFRYGARITRERPDPGSPAALLLRVQQAALTVPVPPGVYVLPAWTPAPEIWGPAQELWLSLAGCACAPSDGPGRVPDGVIPGSPFRIGKNGSTPGALDFSWSPSCTPSANDYAIEAGTLGNWYDHRAVSCSTSGVTFATVQPATGNQYYLVVPLNDFLEGSYGTYLNAVERPPSQSLCRGGFFPTSCP